MTVLLGYIDLFYLFHLELDYPGQALGYVHSTVGMCKVASRLNIFIHANILVLVCEFVVVVILSEWWSVPTIVGTSCCSGFLSNNWPIYSV